MSAEAVAGKLLSNPTTQRVLIYGGLGLVALYVVPRLVPALVSGIGNAFGDLIGGTIRAGAGLVGRGLQAVNPANQENVIYDGIVGGIGRAASGDEHWTFGGFLYDLFNEEYDPNAPAKGKAAIVAAQHHYPQDPKYKPQVIR